MKATHNSATNNNSPKTSPDIRNHSLFTNITSEEEVFVRGGAARFDSEVGSWYLKKEKGGACL